MGISTFILGKSGMGKSTSLEQLDPKKVLLIKTINKPLPFKSKGWEKWDADKKTGTIIHTDNTKLICAILKGAKEKGKSIVIIDDFQYLMANEFMRSWQEKGFDKFSRLGNNIWELLMVANDEADEDLRIYMLSHTDEDETGTIKAKTIGKLLDDKISIEGVVTIVLRAMKDGDEYVFSTQNNGRDTCKSPKGMFEKEFIPNDLAMVDKAICEYYDIKGEK